MTPQLLTLGCGLRQPPANMESIWNNCVWASLTPASILSVGIPSTAAVGPINDSYNAVNRDLQSKEASIGKCVTATSDSAKVLQAELTAQLPRRQTRQDITRVVAPTRKTYFGKVTYGTSVARP
jgi:hypothetical protein